MPKHILWAPTLSILLALPAFAADTIAPTVPSNLQVANITPSGFTASWTKSTDNVGVAYYELWLGNLMTKVIDPTTYFKYVNLTTNSSYNMVVRAVDSSGNKSSYSNKISITLSAGNSDTTPPAQPGPNTIKNISDTGFSVSWGASTDNTGISHYELWRGNTMTKIEAPLAEYTFSGLSPNTSYNITTRAVDTAGNKSSFNLKTTVTTNTTPTNDAYWSSVFLLLPLNEPDNTGTFLDAKGHVVTSEGGLTTKTLATPLFGQTTAAYFDDTDNGLLLTGYTNGSDFDFYGAPFTFEFWIYRLENSSGAFDHLLTQRDDGHSGQGLAVYLDNSDGSFLFKNGTDTGIGTNSSNPVPLNKWTHIAISGDATTIRGFVNGKKVFEAGGFVKYQDIPTRFGIGNDKGLPGKYYIAQMRGTKYQRYTTEFLPPNALFPKQ